jgi:hypothetical protein
MATFAFSVGYEHFLYMNKNPKNLRARNVMDLEEGK